MAPYTPKELDQALLEALTALSAAVENGEVPDYGICKYLNQAFYGKEASDSTRRFHIYDRMKYIFIGWPKYSGNCLYPVPEPDHLGDGHLAIIVYNSQHKWTGPYGKLRKELLDYCIDYLTSKLEA